jgi:TPR repeat protein
VTAPQTNRSFAVACDLWQRGRVRAAFSKFLDLARRGDVSAQVNLAHFYSEGLASPKDTKQARVWSLRAFRGGAVHAATNLGINYWSEGKLVLAEKWLIKAAEQGDGDAWLELARLYLFAFADGRKSRAAARRVLAAENVTEHSRAVAKALLGPPQTPRRK